MDPWSWQVPTEWAVISHKWHVSCVTVLQTGGWLCWLCKSFILIPLVTIVRERILTWSTGINHPAAQKYTCYPSEFCSWKHASTFSIHVFVFMHVGKPVQRTLQACLCPYTDQTRMWAFWFWDSELDPSLTYFIDMSIYSLCLISNAKSLSKSKSFITFGRDLNRGRKLKTQSYT